MIARVKIKLPKNLSLDIVFTSQAHVAGALLEQWKMFRQLCSSMVTLKFSGHLKTTWTTFCPILTTYLLIVDFCGYLVHYLPFVHVDIEKSPYPLAYLNLFYSINFHVYFGLPINHINIHKQKLPGKKNKFIFLSIISSFWTRFFIMHLSF